MSTRHSTEGAFQHSWFLSGWFWTSKEPYSADVALLSELKVLGCEQRARQRLLPCQACSPHHSLLRISLERYKVHPGRSPVHRPSGLSALILQTKTSTFKRAVRLLIYSPGPVLLARASSCLYPARRGDVTSWQRFSFQKIFSLPSRLSPTGQRPRGCTRFSFHRHPRSFEGGTAIRKCRLISTSISDPLNQATVNLSLLTNYLGQEYQDIER